MSSYYLFNLVKYFICNYTGVIVNRVNSRPLGFGQLYCLVNIKERVVLYLFLVSSRQQKWLKVEEQNKLQQHAQPMAAETTTKKATMTRNVIVDDTT
jgi:hypothetical protein